MILMIQMVLDGKSRDHKFATCSFFVHPHAMNCRKSMVAPKPMQARCYCKIDVFSFEDIVVVEEPNL